MNNVPMTLPELALSMQKQDYYHSVTYAQLDDGRIACAGKMRNFCFSEDGGLTWSKDKVFYDKNGNCVEGHNLALVKLPGEGIGLAGMEFTGEMTHNRRDNVLFWRSADGGKTWEPPVQVNVSNFNVHMMSDTALRTSSGRIVLPMCTRFYPCGYDYDKQPWDGALLESGCWVPTAGHFNDPIFAACLVYFSDDDGRSWHMNHGQGGEWDIKKGGSQGIPSLIYIIAEAGSYLGTAFEPSVAEVHPGVLLLMMRTGLGRLYQSWSFDNGTTWGCAQPTMLASSHAPAQIRALPNGHLLCIWNQHSHDEIRRGLHRCRLSSSLSRDGGRCWEFFQNVESVLEQTRVEPGPIGPVRPEQIHSPVVGQQAYVRDPEHIRQLPEGYGVWSYPSVGVCKDRVLISHTYAKWNSKGQFMNWQGQDDMANRPCNLLKVLPLKWFYGGEEPYESNSLGRGYEPAKP